MSLISKNRENFLNMEKGIVKKAIIDTDARLSSMVGVLGVSKSTVQRLIKRHGLYKLYRSISLGRGSHKAFGAAYRAVVDRLIDWVLVMEPSEVTPYSNRVGDLVSIGAEVVDSDGVRWSRAFMIPHGCIADHGIEKIRSTLTSYGVIVKEEEKRTNSGLFW